jgi:hypothetical protein
MNHSRTEPVHFVQMWVVPDTTGIEPGYEQLDVSGRLAGGDLVPVASGRAEPGAIRINQKGATMWVARMAAGGQVALPDAPFVHAFVARGEIELEGRQLRAGDAARLTSAGPCLVTASVESEIVVWESDHQAG